MGAYLRPQQIGEALEALDRGPLTVIAGGTDFYPARVGRPLDDDILDISAINGLRGIAQRDGAFHVGAATTWTDVLRADLPPCFDGLRLAAREVGGVQIQNAGTVCGNICNASPAADGVPPLLSLDAEVELASLAGTRRVPLARFITGNRRTLRRTDELVTGLVVPDSGEDVRSGFLKLGARKYLVISIVMVAAVLRRAADGTVASARVAVGSCSEVAQRLDALERDLVGRSLSADLGGVADARHFAPLSPIDDVRATASYREHGALTLVRRLLGDLGEAG